MLDEDVSGSNWKVHSIMHDRISNRYVYQSHILDQISREQ